MMCSGLSCHTSCHSACIHHLHASDTPGARAQVAIAVMHLGRLRLASNTLSVLVAFQVLLLWVRAQYFARRGPHTAPCVCS